MENKDLSELIRLFGELQHDVVPSWGILTPQHVLEHLSASFRMSNGSIALQQAISDDQIPARLEFLYSDQPFPKNLRNAALPVGELGPLKTASMADAHAFLVKMWNRFEQHFEEQPKANPVHPLFGPLRYEQWVRFHARHMEHHAIQFKLLPNS